VLGKARARGNSIMSFQPTVALVCVILNLKDRVLCETNVFAMSIWLVFGIGVGGYKFAMFRRKNLRSKARGKVFYISVPLNQRLQPRVTA